MKNSVLFSVILFVTLAMLVAALFFAGPGRQRLAEADGDRIARVELNRRLNEMQQGIERQQEHIQELAICQRESLDWLKLWSGGYADATYQLAESLRGKRNNPIQNMDGKWDQMAETVGFADGKRHDARELPHVFETLANRVAAATQPAQ